MTRHTHAAGFTLIELIVIIVLVGIVASFLIVFTTGNAETPDVVLISQREASVERVMERIIADYREEINGADPDAALATIVGREATYEALGALVDFDYITFTAGGAEQIPGGTTTTLKVTVYVDPAGDGSRQLRTTTLLAQARTTAGGEAAVSY